MGASRKKEISCVDPHRRGMLALAGSAALPGIARAKSGSAERRLRIGFQKYGNLTLLKAKGALDAKLAAEGVDVRWTEFPAGPQLLEALNVGAIDFGNVGEAPPIFAQAAGAQFLYVAYQPPAPGAEALIVLPGSSLRSFKDLRGRRIALNKGSNVHYLLVRALEEAGLSYGQIEPVFLAPADARAAFERGAVDAWAIWDPFLAAAQVQLDARVLRDGTGLVSNHQFFLAATAFAQSNPRIVAAAIDELAKTDAWAARSRLEVIALLSPQLGLPGPTVERATARLSFGTRRVGPDVAREQQRVADAFRELRLIPHAVRIADALPSRELALALQASTMPRADPR
jgi:sulfonate transport system substrate-binding protein